MGSLSDSATLIEIPLRKREGSILAVLSSSSNSSLWEFDKLEKLINVFKEKKKEK